MKTHHRYSILCAALLATCLSPNRLGEETSPPQEPAVGRKEVKHVTLVAEVTGINLTNREITLKKPDGQEVTLTASKAVKRLNEVQVGDLIRADYLVSVAAELRKPTPEEAAHPLVIMDAEGRASTNAPPVGVVARRFKVVTTIEELNLTNQTVTVKGPLGRQLTARVADPSRLKKAKVGETIVIVYTEALALSLEKMPKQAK